MGALARKGALVALMLFSVAAAAGEAVSRLDQWNRQRVPGVAASLADPKPWGKGQEAPLTPEYQAVLEASLAAQQDGFFDWLGASCRGFKCRW
jgi:hypothetical protein